MGKHHETIPVTQGFFLGIPSNIHQLLGVAPQSVAVSLSSLTWRFQTSAKVRQLNSWVNLGHIRMKIS